MKRSSPISRAKSSSTPQALSAPIIVAALPSVALKSGLAPSPNEDDHLTIKRLKVQHSQGSGLHALTFPTFVQPPKPVQPAVPIQFSIHTSSPAIIMDIEDSDEK